MAPRLSFQPAGENDLERLVEIHAHAFPDDRGRDARARHLTRNAFGGLEDLWVAAVDGTPVAHAFLFPLEVWFGGSRVRVGGIASLGVAPEARRQGVASSLVGHLHEVARERGDALTVLYPFRQAFYARLGYGPTSAYQRLTFAPWSVPWRAELPMRAATSPDRGALRSCWEAAGRRRTGMLVRSERKWDACLLDERRTWLVVEGSAGVEGYVAWTVSQREGDGRDGTIDLRVAEMAALTPAAERTLWGALAAQRHQAARVLVDVPAGDCLDAAMFDGGRTRFDQAGLEHVRGELLSGPMLRLVDPARAFGARGWSEEASLVVEAGDQRLAISVRGGRATVSPARSTPDVWMTPMALGAVAFGALPASQAARLDWLRVRDDRTLARAEALFALPAYFSPDPF
jgi:predicted acetyltransferase